MGTKCNFFIFFAVGVKQNQARLKKLDGLESGQPWFPRQGIFILGQEQESLCGGFDNYDSLSADVSMFQVRWSLFYQPYVTFKSKIVAL